MKKGGGEYRTGHGPVSRKYIGEDQPSGLKIFNWNRLFEKFLKRARRRIFMDRMDTCSEQGRN